MLKFMDLFLCYEEYQRRQKRRLRAQDHILRWSTIADNPSCGVLDALFWFSLGFAYKWNMCTYVHICKVKMNL
ncbi:rCG26880, partial [Rattus norvegicus]